MWIVLLSLLVFGEDVTGAIDCEVQLFHQCQRPKLFQEIPRKVEQFKALCPELSSYMQCLSEYDMQCNKEDERMFENPDMYSNLIALFDEICEEGSNLNEVATSHLECFNETFSNTNCRQETNAFLEPYEREEALDEFTTTKVIPNRVYCLSQILLAGCFAEDISRSCGIRARHATVEFIHRSNFLDASCPLRYRESLLPDIDEFSLTEGQKTFAVAELERMKISDGF